ncbi:MAG: 8-amino-7-oxononanoate synthase [Bacteroidota bacterium]
MFNERLRARLEELSSQNNRRYLPNISNGVDFWSNDYLGLARDLPNSMQPSGGSTGSRLISGNKEEYEQTEMIVAHYHKAASALVFSSGYAANVGLLSSIPSRHDVILYDSLIHASLRDGIRLSLARALPFRHNDLHHLRERLRKVNGTCLVVTESVFSMDGDVAPLKDMLSICQEFGAAMIVDEAHAIGVFGPQGSGKVTELGLEDDIFARIVTFGKALGVHGAAVLGSGDLVDYLINHARSFIFSTGPSPHQWKSIREAYTLLEESYDIRRQALERNMGHLNTRLRDLPLGYFVVHTPIVPIKWPGNEAVIQLETVLQEAGLLVKGIRHPTVARGEERLRISLHAFNTIPEIDRLVETLQRSLPNEY